MKIYDRAPDDGDSPLPPEPASRPPQPSRRTIAILCVVTVCLTALAITLVASASSVEPDAAMQAAPAMTVSLVPVSQVNWDSTLEASGAIEPWQEAVLGTQTSGLRLLEVKAGIGDTVQRGQVLARFDSALLRASHAELQASLVRAEAEARQADANRQRMHSIKDSGGISQQEMLQYETVADTSSAQVALVRAQLEARRLQLDHAEIKAPDQGIISARTATVGAVADSCQELFRLIRQGRLEWRGELTALQLTQIAPGQQVLLNLPDGSRATARVRQSAPRLDAQSRLAIVYADIDAGSHARAGMYAAGRVILLQRPALVLPAASVVVRDGRSYVFKVADAARPVVRAQAVKVGRRQGNSVEVLDSVSAGERVVLQGAGFLKDGDTVHVVPAAMRTATPAAKG